MSSSIFIPLFKPTASPNPSQHAVTVQSRGHTLRILRDQLSVSSWLCLGAVLGAALHAIFGRLLVAVPAAVLLLRILDAILQANGVRPNPYMKNVLTMRTTAQRPNEDGSFGPQASSRQVCVFLFGARNNHPLGILAPNFKELGDFFGRLNESVEANRSEYEFLGSSDWIANAERATNNTLMTVMYFGSAEGVRKFAHATLHLEAWEWWKGIVAKTPHLTIFHELYVSPAGHWETIYDNAAPMLLGAAQFPVQDGKGGRWISATVDASAKSLQHSIGRMGGRGFSLRRQDEL